MKQKVQIAKDSEGRKIVVLHDIIFKNKQKIDWNAGNGWYYYTTRFAIPIYENDIKSDIYNIYSACLLINRTKFGKMYLYDLVDIKKEASTPLKNIK